jgi:hypothetical protein
VLGRALLIVALGAPSAQAQSTDEAEVTLQAELQSLIRNGASVGAVLGPQETFHARARRGSVASDAENRRLQIEGLSSRWSERLSITDGSVVRVRSKSAKVCEASLAQYLEAESIGGTATEVMFGIAKAVDPRLASLPPPALLSGGGTNSDEPSKLQSDSLWLTGGRITVEDALNQFVTRVGGVGWWVAERCLPGKACSCNMGLMTADRVLFSMYDISPPSYRAALR